MHHVAFRLLSNIQYFLVSPPFDSVGQHSGNHADDREARHSGRVDLCACFTHPRIGHSLALI
jgi:hypothetical protein